MKHPKEKGNRFERKVAKMIAEVFGSKAADVYKTPLSGGHHERGDILMAVDLLQKFPFFIECRDRKVWTWENFFKKAEESILGRWYFEDAVGKCHPHEGVERIPILVFKHNRGQVYVMTSSMYPDPLATFDKVMGPLITVPFVMNGKAQLFVVELFSSLLTRHKLNSLACDAEKEDTSTEKTNVCDESEE